MSLISSLRVVGLYLKRFPYSCLCMSDERLTDINRLCQTVLFSGVSVVCQISSLAFQITSLPHGVRRVYVISLQRVYVTLSAPGLRNLLSKGLCRSECTGSMSSLLTGFMFH